ncbi:cytochrome P450 4V2 [Caerostris extrusa]|uniref:Cytochrome P450 4V2 n=1 Tax=Caerostris extrusa TaxID=172846 RepID=A0AAV4N4R4_CAEEX|nr:cytochrome P450 4V2 [Caerostris extrusa]
MSEECNRLYPPAPIIARKISEEISICGFKIPKRTHVVVSPFLVHRDEDVFPVPEKFDPERFLPENSAHIPEKGLWRDGSESPGVSHSEKLLPSLSGHERPCAPHHKTQSPFVSTRPHQISTQTTGGHIIPKRAHVIVSPFLVHRDEDVFPDPEKFDPHRFLPENSSHIPECAYIPFAADPRNCMDLEEQRQGDNVPNPSYLSDISNGKLSFDQRKDIGVPNITRTGERDKTEENFLGGKKNFIKWNNALFVDSYRVGIGRCDRFHLVRYIRKGRLAYLYNKIFHRKVKKKFGHCPLFTHWLCGVRLVIIHKAEAVKDLLKEKRIIEKSDFYDFFKPYVGTGIITCDSSQWKERRKLLAPCFHSSMLKGNLTVFNEHAQKLVEFLHEETDKRIHHRNEGKAYVSSLHRLLDVAMTRIWKFWLWPDFIFHCSKAYKEFMHHIRIAHGFSRSIIKQKKHMYMNGEMGDNSTRPKCLLDVLLKLHIEDQVLDEEGVRQEVDTFISAGHDIITVVVKWALIGAWNPAIAVKWAPILIGLYPEVQEKIHQELDSVLGADRKAPLSVGDLKALKYLECVLKECNRIYPPAPAIIRKISEDISVCGYTIPKRAHVIVAPFFLHRDEDVFPDPEKFDPERFLPENSAHIPECAYIPFAAGPRDCIGRVFAEMEVKILVCHILRNFSLRSLDSRDQVLPIIQINLLSSQPARIKFRRRQQ